MYDYAGIQVLKNYAFPLAIYGEQASHIGKFLYGMVAGRGFIALAAVILGKWKPVGVVAACVFFGFSDAFQLRLQSIGSPIPYQFLIMLPYILTMIALAGLVGKTIPPAASGNPYIRSK